MASSTSNASRGNDAGSAEARAKHEPGGSTVAKDEASKAPSPGTGAPGTGATTALADFVVSSTYAGLPDHLVAHLRRLLLDNIGNTAFAGSA